MKTLILSAVLFLNITMNVTASGSAIPENTKVINAFHKLFKSASNVSWRSSKRYFEASFFVGEVKNRAIFNKKGKLMGTIRDYRENNLPAIVSKTVKEDFPDLEICYVTEICNDFGLMYKISLRGARNYYFINTNDAGASVVEKIYKRGDL